MAYARRDRGSAVVLTTLIAFALAGAAVVAAIPMAVGLAERQRAHAAADAAALAGVHGGRPAAARLAAANDGELVAWSQHGPTVTVTVRVGNQQVTARATNGP